MSATIKQCAIALLLVGSSGVANASTQGTPGATSTGSVNINASVPARVRITNLTDVNLTNVEPTVDALNAQSVCVWSNSATRGYRVTAQGSGAGNAFTLSSGAYPVVPYTVEWAASAGQSAGTGLSTGVALTGLTSAATSADCSSGPSNSASLIVKIGSSELQAMPAATTFTGSLTLVVAPE